MMNDNESIDQLSKRIGVLSEHLTQLGNAPVQGCTKCKGTGIKRITASGRHVPCACTNPSR